LSQSLIFSIFILTSSFYLLIGVLASRHIRTQKDYFLADRKLGIWPITATLVATQIGGGLILGTADAAYQMGLASVLYAIGMVLAFVILALGVAGKLRSLSITTTAEIFTTHYNSLTLRRLAGLIMVLSLTGILAAQVLASRKLLIALDIYHPWLFLSVWLLIVLYTMLGGLKAVVATDAIQLVIILIIFIAIFAMSLIQYPISTLDWQTSLPVNQPTLPWFSLLVMPILFNTIEQDLAQRFFAARNQKVAMLAAGFAALMILLFTIVPIYFGSLAQHLNLNINAQSATIIVVLQHLASDWVILLAALALFAAIISSADSVLCAISSNISLDLLPQWGAAKHNIHFPRMITLLVGCLAILIALQFDNVLAVLVHSFALPVSCLAVSIFASLFIPQVYTLAATLSLLCGLCGFLLGKLISLPLNPDLFALLLSLIGFITGHYLASAERDVALTTPSQE
jgi:SSS family solute:Na+ symporter